MFSLSITQAGFIKGVLLSALFAVVAYFADTGHLTGVINPALAAIVAGLASSLESYLKAQSGNTTALFGAVALK